VGFKYAYWTENATNWITVYDFCNDMSAAGCDLQIDENGCFQRLTIKN
jgi:hypothetical protein